MVTGERDGMHRIALALALAGLFTAPAWAQDRPGGGQSEPSATGPGGPGTVGPTDIPVPRSGSSLDLPSDAGDLGIPGGQDEAGVMSPLPPTATTLPSYLVTPGPSPAPVFSNERSRRLEAEIAGRIETINDPIQKALALERLGLTKLRNRQLSEADQVMKRSASIALEAPPSLSRDLRVIQIIDVLIDLATAQLIEGLSSASTMEADLEFDLPPALEENRLARLEQARTEWQLAYRLSNALQNVNYASEQVSKTAISESVGSQTIARSGLRGSLLPLSPDLPRADLLRFADELLVEAATQAASIKRVVWRHRTLVEVATTAAEALQLARARAIAWTIKDPASRSEALVRTAESLVLLDYRVESELPNFLNDSWNRFRYELENTKSTLEAELPASRVGGLSDSSFTLDRKEDALDDLSQAAANLDQRVQLLTQLVHNAEVARATAYSGELSKVPLRKSEQLERDLERVLPRISNLRKQLEEQLRGARAARTARLEPGGRDPAQAEKDPFLAIGRSLPTLNDADWKLLDSDLQNLIKTTIALGPDSLMPEATEIYNAAAGSIASIDSPDPRSDSANLLIKSLIAVNRFQDARAAVTLLPGPDRQLRALGLIAEAQGRRGLAESAFAWIQNEIPDEYRAQLIRQVEEGVLATVDENRIRRAMDGSAR